MLINMIGLDSVCETTNTKITEARHCPFYGRGKNNGRMFLRIINTKINNSKAHGNNGAFGPRRIREVFYPAIKDGARAIIVVHNTKR